VAACAVVALPIVGSAKPAIGGVDSGARLAMQRRLLASTPPNEPFDQKYNASLPILAAPLHWLGELRSSAERDRTGATVAHWNHAVLAAFLVWLYRRLRLGAGSSGRAALVCTWVTLVTSLALPHSRDFYSELTWCVALLVALDYLVRALDASSRSTWLALGAATFVAAWVNPAVGPLWMGTAVAVAWQARASTESGAGRRAVVVVGLGLVLACAAQLIENRLERGHLFDGGYGTESFRFHPAGIAGLLVSPGKGAAFFLPQVVLLVLAPSWRAWPERLRAWAGPRILGAVLLSAGLVVLYGSWWSWGGGRYFGPRFLLLPSLAGGVALGMATARWRALAPWQRVAVWAFVLYGCAVTVLGLAVNQRYFDACASLSWEACHWSFVESPWWILGRPWAEIVGLAKSRGLASVALGSLAIAAITARGGTRPFRRRA